MSSANSRITNRYEGFDPRQITNCQLWLDAADTSTLYSDSGGTTLASVGNTIGYWRDKSIRGRNYTQATAGNRPTYAATGRVNFALDDFLVSSATWTTGTQYNVFAVVKPTTSTADWRTLLRGLTYDHHIIVQTGTTNLGYYNNTAGAFYQFGSATLDGNSVRLVSVSIASTRAYSGALNSSFSGLTSATGTGTADTNMFYYFGGAGGSQGFGDVYELLIYGGDSAFSLNFQERMIIENYLSRKWGLLGNVTPAANLYPKIDTYSRRFEPIDIPGCYLWLDAQDNSTMTFSGSAITQWNDKSGNGSNFTAGSSPTLTTINGAQMINTTGNGHFFRAAGSYTFPSVYSIFTVGYSTITSSYVGLMWATPDATFMLRALDNAMSVWKGNGSVWGSPTATYTPITNNAIWTAINVATGATSNLTMYVNGTSNSVNSGTANSTGTGLYIGLWGTSTTYSWRGYLGDVIIYNVALTTPQRQRVEGYLADKYNLRSVLPSTHPYKIIPSPSILFDPMSLSGAGPVLWLDGSDINSSSGGTWLNKTSGASFTGTPTFASLGNNNVVNTSGNQTFSNATYSLAPVMTLFAVAYTTASTSFYTLVNAYSDIRFMLRASGGAIAVFKGNGTSWGTTTGSGVTINSALTLLTLTHPTSSGTMSLFGNGSSTASSTCTGVTMPTVTGLYIGSWATANYWNGYIGEVIIYNTALSTGQIKLVEGYLAWKYNIQGSLPAAHPFKRFRP